MHDALFDEAVPVDVREIALRDPKRARRILANRQSAARSKERKQRYVQSLNERFATLEEEEKALIMEAEALATAVAMGAENSALAMMLEAKQEGTRCA